MTLSCMYQGNFRGVKGAARTFTPVDLWDVEIKTQNKALELELTDGHNCIVFVRSGRRRHARMRAWACELECDMTV